mgnify:CR=1 FL=1
MFDVKNTSVVTLIRMLSGNKGKNVDLVLVLSDIKYVLTLRRGWFVQRDTCVMAHIVEKNLNLHPVVMAIIVVKYFGEMVFCTEIVTLNILVRDI